MTEHFQAYPSAKEITRLCGGDWHGTYGNIPGPGRSSANRSVTVKDSNSGGEPIFYSHRGDDWKVVKDDLRTRGILPEHVGAGGSAPTLSFSDGEKAKSAPGDGGPVASYKYETEQSALVFTIDRFEDGNRKRFMARPAKEAQPIPYRLPDIKNARDFEDRVWIVEGEKDADTLAALGFHATCNAFGAGKWTDQHSKYLADLDVVILPDNDEIGREHAQKVAQSLYAVSRSVTICELPGLPEKGDVTDWFDAGGTMKELLDLANQSPVWEPKLEDGFFSAAQLSEQDVKPRKWLVKDYIPENTVTMLGGDGGTGKSLLALQLAVSVSAGVPWMNREVETGGVVYISAEDDTPELHWRLDRMLMMEGLQYDRVENLSLRSLAGKDALLATEDRAGLKKTSLFNEIDAYVAEVKPKLLVLDTLADFFPGNENDRSEARQFIGMLRGIAIRHECAVLLLSHPSLTGISSGTGTSGSTGWSNSVRSRIYLSRVKDDDGYEADPDRRILSVKKTNYARVGTEISMSWENHIFVAHSAPELADKAAASVRAERVFLKILDEMTAQGRSCSPSRSPSFAPTVFARHPHAEGCSKRALEVAMEELLRREVIEVAEKGPPSRRTTFLRKKAGVREEE